MCTGKQDIVVLIQKFSTTATPKRVLQYLAIETKLWYRLRSTSYIVSPLIRASTVGE